MNLGSPIELYLTYYGWSFYDNLWQLFAGTGLALYPFAFTVYITWRSSSERATDDAPAAVTSVRAMQWALYTQFAVMILAAIPMTELQTGQMAYQKACGGGANQVGGTWDSTGTTWDGLTSSLGSGSTGTGVNPRVPLFWSAVMSIASGINYAATENIPCFGNISGMVKNISTTTFSDSNVRTEFKRFATECWGPATTKYQRAMLGGDWDTYVHESFAAAKLPPWDVRKPGSEYFLGTPGFYQPCTDHTVCGAGLRAKSPVKGFPYDAARDGGDFNAGQVAAGIGQPTCQEWWQGTGNGNSLRENMIDQAILSQPIYPNTGSNPVSPLVRDQIEAVRAGGGLTAGFLDNPTVEDNVILNALIANEQRRKDSVVDKGINAAKGFFNAVQNTFTGLVGGATFVGASFIPGVGDVIDNIASESASFYAAMYIAKVGAPLMQALLLMLIYGLLPIYLITSGYQVESVITAAVLIGTIKFFTVVWALAAYLENAVIQVLYPNQMWADTVSRFGPASGIERGVLNIMLISLYVIVPVFLLYLVSLAGPAIHSAGRALNDASGGSTGIAGAGGKGVGKVGKGIANARRK